MLLSLSVLLLVIILSVNAGCKENIKELNSLIIDGHEYRIGAKLGSGRYGSVYLGNLVPETIDEGGMDPVIALKVISKYKPEKYIVKPEILSLLQFCNVDVEEWYFNKVLRESAILSMVQLDAGSPIQPDGNFLVIPMKIIRGARLCDFVQHNIIHDKLTLDDIIYLQDMVIEQGFGTIHKQNVVHGDGHAGNIMMKISNWSEKKGQLSKADFTIHMIDYGRSSVYLRDGKPVGWKSSEECAIIDKMLIGERKAFQVSEQALHKDIQFFLCTFPRDFEPLLSDDQIYHALIKRCLDYTSKYKLERVVY